MLLTFADWLCYEIWGLSPATKAGQAVHFFVYDYIKIILLLFSLIFTVGILRTFLPRRKMRQWMSRRGLISHAMAATFGAVTPFCSCSSIPIFLGFLEAGVPLGPTFSFLITSPIINEYLVVLMLGFFGWKITLAYVLSGLMIGMVAGGVLGRMKVEKLLVDDVAGRRAQDITDPVYGRFSQRVMYGWNEALTIVKKIWIWVMVGVGIGALVHNYVPQESIQAIISRTGVFSVPIATVLGVPIYGSCAAIVPIAIVLFQKGLPLGTALAFMMAIAALSLPEAVILRRAMRLKLILIFFGITALAIMLTGYLFNYLQAILI